LYVTYLTVTNTCCATYGSLALFVVEYLLN